MKQDCTSEFSIEKVDEIYSRPLFSLLSDAAYLQKKCFASKKIEKCTLLSIKTGNCPEDCAYCSQSSYYSTNIVSNKFPDIEDVIKAAKEAKNSGSNYFALSAAWRRVEDNLDFEKALEMIRRIKKEVKIKVCATFGLLSDSQAVALKEAGLSCYNHNLDTSPSYYSQIITTRKFEDRLKTLQSLRKADISICCGGILGLGESDQDRKEFIQVLINLPRIDSVVLNTLIPISGTPLENNKQVSLFEFLRVVSTIRILRPKLRIRFAGGRSRFTEAEQSLTLLVGVNSFHTGEKLLTTKNCSIEDDDKLFHLLGI